MRRPGVGAEPEPFVRTCAGRIFVFMVFGRWPFGGVCAVLASARSLSLSFARGALGEDPVLADWRRMHRDPNSNPGHDPRDPWR